MSGDLTLADIPDIEGRWGDLIEDEHEVQPPTVNPWHKPKPASDEGAWIREKEQHHQQDDSWTVVSRRKPEKKPKQHDGSTKNNRRRRRR